MGVKFEDKKSGKKFETKRNPSQVKAMSELGMKHLKDIHELIKQDGSKVNTKNLEKNVRALTKTYEAMQSNPTSNTINRFVDAMKVVLLAAVGADTSKDLITGNEQTDDEGNQTGNTVVI